MSALEGLLNKITLPWRFAEGLFNKSSSKEFSYALKQTLKGKTDLKSGEYDLSVLWIDPKQGYEVLLFPNPAFPDEYYKVQCPVTQDHAQPNSDYATTLANECIKQLGNPKDLKAIGYFIDKH